MNLKNNLYNFGFNSFRFLQSEKLMSRVVQFFFRNLTSYINAAKTELNIATICIVT